MDWFGTWGMAMGAAWLSGLRLYASVLTLGFLQHFGYAHLFGDLSGRLGPGRPALRSLSFRSSPGGRGVLRRLRPVGPGTMAAGMKERTGDAMRRCDSLPNAGLRPNI